MLNLSEVFMVKKNWNGEKESGVSLKHSIFNYVFMVSSIEKIN